MSSPTALLFGIYVTLSDECPSYARSYASHFTVKKPEYASKDMAKSYYRKRKVSEISYRERCVGWVWIVDDLYKLNSYV
jgi:hypothetical protein